MQQAVRELAGALDAKDRQLADQAATLDRRARELEELRLLLAQLKRRQFGRRSEQLEPDQLQLGLEELEQAVAAAEAARTGRTGGAPSATPSKPRRNRGAPPAHLPRIEVVVDVDDKTCPCCGGALHVIGEDVAEMLDVVPAQFRVKVIRRPRYGCRACAGAMVQATAPERPIDGRHGERGHAGACPGQQIRRPSPLYR